MKPKLSILIPTIPERTKSLANLLEVLSGQMRPGVEIVTINDSKEITLGAKENELLKAARGEYVVFVDDDDMVKANYIEKIFEGIEKDVDIVQIKTDYFVSGVWTAHIIFKIGQPWVTSSQRLLLRGCSKFCPHKREIAMRIMFQDINFVEDRPYAFGLDQICKTEHIIDEPVYEYRYNPK